jgi:predicted GTPase
MQVPNRSLLPTIPPTDAITTQALDLDSSIPNIIVFGETGVGKSSIINMLQGGEVAPTSNSAYGCTSESSQHEVTLAAVGLGFYHSSPTDNICQ